MSRLLDVGRAQAEVRGEQEHVFARPVATSLELEIILERPNGQ